MHENNPFQNIKNYWGSHYSTITESAEKHLADFAGYAVYKDGKWYQSEGDVKKRKGISSDELWNRHGDEYKRHLDSRKGANEDKDSRDGESTRSEEVEYDGDLGGFGHRSTRGSPFNNTENSRTALLRGYRVRGMPNGLPGPDDSAYGRARMRGENPKESIIKAKDRATNTMFSREFPSPRARSRGASLADELFHKDSDRLLREHIRAEYEACGIYPTSREVQETYNHVVSILNERNQVNKEASRRAEIKSGREVQGRNWGSEEDAINSARNTKAGLVNSPMPPTMRQSYDATGIRRSKHIAKRGVQTKISPSSPARQQSEVEKDTRFLMGKGFSPSHLRRIMSDSGR